MADHHDGCLIRETGGCTCDVVRDAVARARAAGLPVEVRNATLFAELACPHCGLGHDAKVCPSPAARKAEEAAAAARGTLAKPVQLTLF